MSKEDGKQLTSLSKEQLATTLAEISNFVMGDYSLKGIDRAEAEVKGYSSDDWNTAGSDVFDENGDSVGTIFEAADGTMRILEPQHIRDNIAAASSGGSGYSAGGYGSQKYSQSAYGGTDVTMGAAGLDPNLTTTDPYRTIPTSQYSQALQTQLPGAQLPAIQELYQQNIPAFQEAYSLAQLLGMVAPDPNATKGQTDTIGFQRFLQTNPDIKSIYSQGLNAIEGVKDQVRAGRLPGSLSSVDQMIYDRFIGGSPENPMGGHVQELMLRQQMVDYLPEAMRYSARMALQRRYDAALTGDPNALATSNIYGTTGNPWAGGATTAMPAFGGNLGFGAGTPMGAGGFTGGQQPAGQTTSAVGPTDNRSWTIGKGNYSQGDTGTRKNMETGSMEVIDLNTGNVLDTYMIKDTPEPHQSGGVQASNVRKYDSITGLTKPALKPFGGTIPTIGKGIIDGQGAAPPMVPHFAGGAKEILAWEQMQEEELRKAKQFENIYR